MQNTIINKLIDVVSNGEVNQVKYNQRVIFEWKNGEPIVYIGTGKETIEMYRGNYDIKDYITERIPLNNVSIEENEDEIQISNSFDESSGVALMISLSFDHESRLKITFDNRSKYDDRFWLRLAADSDEKIYGCGEQYSFFNLRGKNFPLWTSEPGVGRNKKTHTTFLADLEDKAGGDYYTTYYPEQTFVSTKKYYCHVNSYAYSEFDFSNSNFHELHFWEVPSSIIIETGKSYIDIINKMTGLLGRQPELPEWVYNGLVLGIQGGTDILESVSNDLLGKNVKLAGFFAQDWQGIRNTSFGKRLFWDWQWNEELYPELDTKIKEWDEKGLKLMSYINPYVCNDGELFKTAEENSYLALNKNGETYLVDFGEFYCGIVDFTNPEACEWYKSVIKNNMIKFGSKGWMADFGEYLPTDVVLHDKSDPMHMHNKWPMLWAKINYEALEESGEIGKTLFFMRAGATGSQKYCTLMWAGDQSVDWSLDDGLASVIPATLSLGMTGNGLVHSDIGGYTSLHGNIRTKELFMRWTEMATFTPVMRSHEGNRPSENFQVYDNDEAINHLAFFTNVYVDISEYMKKLVKENADTGIPVQRPIFMHYENDSEAYDIQYEYMLGQDVLVAPVHSEGVEEWEVYLPKDQWIHFWTGKKFEGGKHKVKAPIGQPPVFYREDSEYADLFSQFKNKQYEANKT